MSESDDTVGTPSDAGRSDAAGAGPGMPFGANRFGRDRGRVAEEQEPVVIRDKRRVDVNAGGGAESVDSPTVDDAPDAVVDELTAQLAERTADLQRLQAEYANYRKRSDRERQAAGEVAIAGVLEKLLPVLDDVNRARQHDDLTGAFKSVADGLDAVLTKLGLGAFGQPGDPFDPSIHEAVLHDESDDVSVPTASSVMRPGYTFGDRLVRPAMVGVTDPATLAAPAPDVDALADDADQIGI